MFGLGKPEDEERMRDRNSINGVKMGSVFQGLYEANKIKEKMNSCNCDDGYIEMKPVYSSVSVGSKTCVHVSQGEAVNIFVNGQFVYGPIIGNAAISIG